MKELFCNTWAEEDEMVRIFLAAGTKKALIIDTGVTGKDVRAMAAIHTMLPCELLFTHADRDHVAGKQDFGSFYMHPSEAFLYRNAQHGTGRIAPVFDGDVIDLGDRKLEVIHLPGHTPGSITLLDRDARCLIGGDPIQEDGEIYMFGPHRNFEAYIAGLERLMEREDFDWIYPSHAKEKVSRDVIPELIRGAKAILAGELDGEQREMFGQTIRSIDVGPARFLCEV